MLKWILGSLVALAAVVVGGGYFIVTSPNFAEVMKQFNPGAKPTEVRVEPVVRGNLVKVVNAPGTVEAREKRNISARVSSKIIALPFEEGDDVRAGDVVARLDAEDLLADLASAEAGLKGDEARLLSAQADLAEAEADVQRVRGLYETKDVALEVLEASEARYLRAQAAVKMAEHAIEMGRAAVARAKKSVEFTTLTSPIDGTITKLRMKVGEQVLGTFNNEGTVIMEIADLSVMMLRARVDESNIVPVREGQPAKVTVTAYGDRVFTGRVDRVRAQRDESLDGTGYIEAEVLLDLPAGERVKIGLNGNVDIEVDVLRDVLKIPSQAVMDRRVDDLPKDLVDSSPLIDRNKTYARVVYRIEGGKARAVPVSVGPSDLTHTVILAGLEEGDEVITGPFKTLLELKHDAAVVKEGEQKADDDAPEGGAGEADGAATASSG